MRRLLILRAEGESLWTIELPQISKLLYAEPIIPTDAQHYMRTSGQALGQFLMEYASHEFMEALVRALMLDKVQQLEQLLKERKEGEGNAASGV